jgi:Carboxypeptidase regulatory-like domain
MHWSIRSIAVAGMALWVAVLATMAQTGGSGTIQGVVKDPSGAAVVHATVEIDNVVSQYTRTAATGPDGSFKFTNVPLNAYHMTVNASGFAEYTEDVEVRSSVTANVAVSLKVGTAVTSVTVESNGADLVENDPTYHTDVDRDLFQNLPLESSTSQVSSLVTLTTPGMAADSNGLFHGLGDHAPIRFPSMVSR